GSGGGRARGGGAVAGPRRADARLRGRRGADIELREQYTPDATGSGGCPRFPLPGFRPRLYPPIVLPRRWAVPLGSAVGRPGRHLSYRYQVQTIDAERYAAAQLARHGEVAHQIPRPARTHLFGRPW